MMSIAAVVAVAGLLFASTYSQTQMTASSQSVPSAPAQASVKSVDDMGGIQFQMPSAFAQIPADQVDSLAAQGRHVVDVKLVAQSTTLPIMGGGTYYALTFNGQVPGPTVRVT
ncbi:MAG: multicopper oxidase domain-containing protein, partial [Nitrosotalea sp.]